MRPSQLAASLTGVDGGPSEGLTAARRGRATETGAIPRQRTGGHAAHGKHLTGSMGAVALTPHHRHDDANTRGIGARLPT